jgi:hypothetical protein
MSLGCPAAARHAQGTPLRVVTYLSARRKRGSARELVLNDSGGGSGHADRSGESAVFAATPAWPRFSTKRQSP